jgi:hypothetical protein
MSNSAPAVPLAALHSPLRPPSRGATSSPRPPSRGATSSPRPPSRGATSSPRPQDSSQKLIVETVCSFPSNSRSGTVLRINFDFGWIFILFQIV